LSRATLPVLGVALVALIGVGQALHDGSTLRIGSDARLASFVAVQITATVVYFVAVRRVLRGARAGDLWTVLLVAAGMRAIPLIGPQFLSSDVFRYVWDGRVQWHGINPYTFVPADPALAGLRDGAIYPHINRAGYAHTIYPPAAQLVFAAVTAISETAAAMRVAMVAAEAVAIAALLAVLRRIGQPPARVLIYAWTPLAAWEFAGNGHVDALAVLAVALALLAYAAARPAWVGAAMAFGFSAKFLPLAIAPTLWRRRDWRAPLAGLLVTAVLYAPYLSRGVFGFLGGYAGEEGVADGSGLWPLVPFAPLPHWVVGLFLLAVTLSLLALGGLASSGARDIVRTARLAGFGVVTLLVAMSPHYPWYYAWASVPAVIAPTRAAIWLGAAALLLYLSPLNERFVWPALLYVPTVALAVWDIRRPLHPRGA